MRNWFMGRAAQEQLTPLVNGAYVPPEFKNNIISHIYANVLFPEQAPVLLMVLGEPGIGKTFQVKQVCQHWGVHCELTSGATFQAG